jgi:Flp pilus assembly protein TadG
MRPFASQQRTPQLLSTSMRDNPSATTRIHQRLRSERGTAMVEMALVLPILLFLALAIVDFGRAMNYWNDVNQLAADGARFAAVNKNPGDDNADPADDDFREWIRFQADTGELQDGTVADDTEPDGRRPSEATTGKLQVCVGKPGQGTLAAGDLTVGKPVEVVVETNYNLIPFLAENTQFGSVKIRGSAVMRLERNYTMDTGCTAP